MSSSRGRSVSSRSEFDATDRREVGPEPRPRFEPRTKATTVAVRRPAAHEGHRDTVEAIVVAFILTLVVRGFEAQAFVIPTGSMAPTLMGRHKEIACPQCGFVYAVNASEEVETRADAAERLLRSLRQLPLPGRFGPRAQLQGRPDPRDAVSVRPAVPPRQRSARAVGRGCVSVSRRAGNQLHQAPGGLARRDDPDFSRRRISSSRPTAISSRLRANRSGTRRRCRSTF